MKDYPQIIAGLKNSLWLIEKHSLTVMLDIVNRRLSGDVLDEEEIRLRIEAADNGDREHSRVEIGGGIGVISVYGPIFPKSNLMTELSGATSLETFRRDLQNLVENDKVKSIVMDMDTPGGAANMIEETGNFIRQAREIKPIYAVANTECCSGGHWLASQATKFYSTLSGQVGSIGVYTVHEDVSKQDEADGRKVTVLTAGEYKAVGNPHEPLTQEGREYIEERLQETYDTFIDAVAEGRGISAAKVRSDYANGRVFSARKALEIGMIDGIKTLDSVVDELLAQKLAPVARSSLVAAMSRQHFRMEHADLEHSEPGTGSPPQRREDGDIEDDELYRREQVPPAFEEPEDQIRNGGTMDEFLERLRERLGLSSNATEDEVLACVVSSSAVASQLGLSDDASSEDILAAIKAQNDELAPLREVDTKVKARREFRDQFPEEFDRMQKLEETNLVNQAKAFSDDFSRFAVRATDGTPTDEKSTRGFSALVLGDIEQAHLDIAKGNFSHAGLENLLTHIAHNGIVDFSEKGSSRSRELRAGGGSENPRQEFLALVREIQEEDELDMKAAIRVAAERDPELFEKYRDPHVAKSS